MVRSDLKCALLFGLLAAALLCPCAAAQQRTVVSSWARVHDAGNVRRVVSHPAYRYRTSVAQPYCEYPAGSAMDHLQGTSTGIELLTLAPPGDTTEYLYVQGSMFNASALLPGQSTRSDTLWEVTGNAMVDIPFWPHYEGQSDQDLLCRYANTQLTPDGYMRNDSTFGVMERHPACVDLIQRSFAWSFPPLDDVILYGYRLTPTQFPLRGAYLVLHFYGGIGEVTADDWNTPSWRAQNDQTLFFEKEHLGVVCERPFGMEGKVKDCVGYRLFPPAAGIPGALRWTFTDDEGLRDALHYGSRRETPLYFASERELTTYIYRLLSAGTVTYTGFDHGSGYIAAGPFHVELGDTLEFWTAEILGRGSDDVRAKSALLDRLSTRRFQAPKPPPPPHLRVERGDKRLLLRWESLPGEVNPELYEDPARADSVLHPFEGYRLYRSTVGLNGPWTLVEEFDIAGNGIAHDFGLRREWTESGLLNDFAYFYAVTAFSRAEPVFGFPSRESERRLSAVSAMPGTPPLPSVGEVAVVPNPYRGDIAYQLYSPPWERPTGKWDTWYENDRRIQFINLPVRCEITIYTLAGDVIEILHHHDASVSAHSWNLTSHTGQAVSSGLYLFAVKDLSTGAVQTGKFVIIK